MEFDSYTAVLMEDGRRAAVICPTWGCRATLNRGQPWPERYGTVCPRCFEASRRSAWSGMRRPVRLSGPAADLTPAQRLRMGREGPSRDGR